MLLDALDLLEFPVDERRLVLVAFPLFTADAFIIFTFLSEGQQSVLSEPCLLPEDMFMNSLDGVPLDGVVLDLVFIFLMHPEPFRG